LDGGGQVGEPLLIPNAPLDRALAPREWHPEIFDALQHPDSNPKIQNWTDWEDCNSSDMDLCEWNGTTVMVFNWGCQHTTEALALAVRVCPFELRPPRWKLKLTFLVTFSLSFQVSPMPLDRFLKGWFE
jgi:hypothetical protein